VFYHIFKSVKNYTKSHLLSLRNSIIYHIIQKYYIVTGPIFNPPPPVEPVEPVEPDESGE
jgi:hypothetical protein